MGKQIILKRTEENPQMKSLKLYVISLPKTKLTRNLRDCLLLMKLAINHYMYTNHMGLTTDIVSIWQSLRHLNM